MISMPEPAANSGPARPVATEPPSPGRLLTGRIAGVAAGRFTVVAGGAPRQAGRAVSCLVVPEADDTVLFFDDGVQSTILAVLARSGLGDATIALPDGAATLTVSAPTMRLEAGVRLDLAAPQVAVKSRRIELFADMLTQVTRLTSLFGDTLNQVFGRHATMAQRIDVTADQRSTKVTGVDVERRGTHVSQAELSSAHATVATLHAKEDIRLDAKRVTVG